MHTKKLKLLWVVILMTSSFTLGYYLKPHTTKMPMFQNGMPRGMTSRGQAPPLRMPMNMPRQMAPHQR